MKRICKECGYAAIGLADLFDHKRIHPKWVRGMKRVVDEMIELERNHPPKVNRTVAIVHFSGNRVNKNIQTIVNDYP